MNLSEELEKLAKLRQEGLLTEQEFMLAKNKLLRTDTPLPNYRDEGDARGGFDSFGRAANRYVTFRMIMTAVGLLFFAVIFFTVWLPHFRAISHMMPVLPRIP